MTLNKKWIKDFDSLIEAIERILPDSEEGARIQCGITNLREDLLERFEEDNKRVGKAMKKRQEKIRALLKANPS